MRFAPTTEQNEFTDAVAALLADTCTPDAVREAWGGEVGAHTELGSGDGRVRGAWDALTDMGVLGLMVPEANGGLGMSDDFLVGIAVACGYAGLPDPLMATAGVAAAALSAARSASQDVDSWLERIATGATVVVGFGADPVVASASSADAFLLFGRDPITGSGDDSVRILDSSEVQLQPLESVDGSRALARVVSSGGAGTTLADAEVGRRLRSVAFDRAAVLDAAVLVGLSRRMLDLTVEYVGERKQFGVPIGTFQAVKHHLANAALGVEFAEPLVRNAAHLLALDAESGPGGTGSGSTGSGSSGSERTVAVSMAKQRSSLAAIAASEITLQCHGAIGYTTEADLHLFMKRAWALAHTHGDADWHRSRVRQHLLAA